MSCLIFSLDIDTILNFIKLVLLVLILISIPIYIICIIRVFFVFLRVKVLLFSLLQYFFFNFLYWGLNSGLVRNLAAFRSLRRMRCRLRLELISLISIFIIFILIILIILIVDSTIALLIKNVVKLLV